MPKTAIFGGTFNPFHIGHYKILETLQNNNDIEKILLMPDKIPPHKVCDVLASDEERIEMCKLAAADFDKTEVCLIEFKREGRSYSVDTVKELKHKYPDTDFTFVLGGDMLVFFDKWYKYEELMKLISFTAFLRTDTDEAEFFNCVNRYRKMGMKIEVIEDKIPDVSSTKIRNDFSNSKPLLNEKIYNFLKSRRVYGE
ncbi:MAG: nicotinate (nicotinamide) nucleotide adenylyltransferase [Clostridia bacterium]|nr:nicotinate (nicotinamide) nucleotide adenylyltransferase [Clostridia bacterium]